MKTDDEAVVRGEAAASCPPPFDLVRAAFDRFRDKHGPPREPRHIHFDTDRDAMSESDDMEPLRTGPGPASDPPVRLPIVDAKACADARVWAVRPDDVVHAPKHCSFGMCRKAGEVKHSNLTGGAAAYSGGELIFVDTGTIIVNGDSGRYGPRSADEMHDVAVAFRDSGYTTYSMGFDADANKPFSFHFIGAPAPELV